MKALKPIVDMVIAEILSVERAQKMLGIKAEPGGSAQAAISINASAIGAVCRECTAFDKESCNCSVNDIKREPEATACRFFDKDEDL